MIIKDMKKTHFALFVALSITVKIAFIGALTLPLGMRAGATTPPPSFADLADDLLPTVVNISTTQKAVEHPRNLRRLSPQLPQLPMFPEGSPFDDFFEDFLDHAQPMMPHNNMPATSLGSGFILSKEKGLIVTNNHVIKDADEIKVTLHNDAILPAELVGTDEKTDIAVLKVDLSKQDVRETTFGDSDQMRVGDWIVAIGNPFGLGGTVTAGIISARQRDINSGPYDDYLQTDASINRGNSGGPMFNLQGQVIGINTAIFSPTGGSVGIGFAIPSALAKPVINQLVEFGHTRRGWLGVRIQSVTDEIAESLGLAKAAGALVAAVTPQGPAETSGFQTGDVILTFDGKPVREMRHLPRIVAETPIDKSVDVVVWRGGQRVTLSAKVGELEKAENDGLLSQNDDTVYEDPSTPKGDTIDSLGLTLAPLSTSLRQLYGIGDNVTGLVITDIDGNSDAAQKGIAEGDVIVDINQKPVAEINELRSEIDSSVKARRKAVLLLINNRGNIQFVAVKLQEIQDTKDTQDEQAE